MARTSEELVLQVSATQELLERQLREMGRNVDTFEQAAEQRLTQLEQRFSGLNLSGAVNAVKDADRQFRASFDAITAQAGQMADAVSRGGAVDLGPIIAQSRQRITLLEAEAQAVAAIAAAEETRLRPMERLTVAEQAQLAAARAAVNASREKVATANQEIARLEALQAALGRTSNAQRQLVQTSGAVRAGMQQAGFQVQDFFVQVAGGTSAIRAFSLQGPQLFGALQLMASGAEEGASKFAKFANFLGGPWGVAIGIAIPVAGMLAEHLLSMGDAADKSKEKVDALTKALNHLSASQGNPDAASLNLVRNSKLTSEALISQLDRQIAAQEKVNKAATSSAFVRAGAGAQTQAYAGGALDDLKAQRKAAQDALTNAEGALATFEFQRGRVLKAQADQDKYEASQKAAREAASKSRKDANADARDALKDAREMERLQKELRTFGMQAAGDASSGKLTDYRYFTPKAGSTGYTLGGQDDPLNKLWEPFEKYRDGMAQVEMDNRKLAESFKYAWIDATQSTINSLQNLANSLKDGDFLGIMSSALSLFQQLGSIGVFGSKIQTNLKIAGARAGGGPVSAGQTYLVGEKGPELFTPTASGSIIANDNLRSPSISSGTLASIAAARSQPVMISVEANDYFDARVQGQAHAVAAPMSVRAAQAGASLADVSATRRRRNTIPSRY